ncbi:cystathionine beta-lyase [Labedella gwakjiensis]|uniref:cysteine-S-conjugate beta-lyase n=1 Tax=Labedella gwakjiensis TaxID=390269 RepID=A0A2P8H011_9MICO|nr:aminotransferase class I/II-fold pyridoxal phosphate-dependent enzyme [Labedella gwakjiensis]PSL39539.1 cystathionine beta-lyase [Labedella gwakjiensis]RUQ86062.1 aminotransferase class I/II-fold pyridoxal phosphate-dependent enzyme [Labedella gwakjiensis]
MTEPTDELSAAPIDVLRSRTSEKWREYPDDVIPMFVAESDFPLAEPIARALHAAIEAGDTGYVASRTGLPDAFAGFARRHWGWDLADATVQTTADVSMGIVEILRRIDVGTGLVITPPVYPPFYMLADEAGATVVDVPLLETGALDLEGIERAFRAGSRALLLCNPHNPLGYPHDAGSLAELADLADRFDATIVSDEIHAPLTHSDARFVPWLSVSDAARRTGFALHAASKAWNIAGLKCALMIAASPRTTAVLRSLPVEVAWRTGQFGVIASIAAYTEGDAWLARAVRTIERNRHTLVRRLGTELPDVVVSEPRAGYLAWVDVSSLGLGEEPADVILRRARVALRTGSDFGPGGAGRVRVNIACDPALLEEAIDRIVVVADEVRDADRSRATS